MVRLWAIGYADQRVRHPGFREAFRAQDAAVARSARCAVRLRIVTTVSQSILEAERDTVPDDLGFRHGDERSVHANARALDPRAGGNSRERLEYVEEFRAAVWIPGVVERVYADDEVVRTERLGPRQREGQKDGVAGRYIRSGDRGVRQDPSARHRHIACQSRAANR